MRDWKPNATRFSGIQAMLVAIWLLVLSGAAKADNLGAISFKHAIPLLAWGLLGGGVLSIAPLLVVLRCIKLLKILLRQGSDRSESPPP